MPAEIRHILFRPSEVVQAIREYHERIGQPLPAGYVSECGPESDGPGGPVRFRLSIAPPEGVAQTGNAPKAIRRDMVIEGATLAAALILHCRTRKIPLPASSDKSLQVFGEQLGLIATYNPRQSTIPLTEQIRL